MGLALRGGERGGGGAAAATLLAVTAAAVVAAGEGPPLQGDVGGDEGFDVRVELKASWPQVPTSALELEWAKRSRGPGEAAALLLRALEVGGAVRGDEGDGSGPASLLLANRHDSPAVEAQRAACRGLAGGGGSRRCGSRPFFAAIRHAAGLAANVTIACNEAELEAELLRSRQGDAAVAAGDAKSGVASSGGANVLVGQQLAVDLPLVDETIGGPPAAAAVVLCGCVQDAALRPFLHWAFRRDATSPGWPLTVVYRQADCPSGQGSSTPPPREVLYGYAVELRVKSDEYKATDDTAGEQAKKAAEDVVESLQDEDDESEDDASKIGAAEALEGVEVAGLRLGVLAGRFPGLGQSLVALRERLEAEGGAADESLKRWELEDLGLKMVQRAIRSPDPLRTLAGVADSFPATMAQLARQTKIRPRLRRAFARLGSDSRGSKANRMELDGRQLKGAGELTLFPVIERLEARITAAARLAAAAVGGAWVSSSPVAAAAAPPAATPAVLAALQRAHAGGANSSSAPGAAARHLPTRLDWRAPCLRWGYHVRNDEEAEDWPQRLSALASGAVEQEENSYESMFGGGAAAQRKPLQVQQPVFTVVFVFDPTQTDSLDLALNLTGGSRPARVALVLAPAALAFADVAAAATAAVESSGAAEAEEAARATARAIADAYAWILKAGGKGDATAARSFLKALKAAPVASASEVDALMKKHLPKSRRGAASAWAKVEASGAASAFEAYVQAKGLSVPSLVVNGRIADGGNASVLMEGLRATLDAEESSLKAAVRAKRLRDGKKIKEGDVALERFMLEDEGVPARTFDPILTPTLIAPGARQAKQLSADADPLEATAASDDARGFAPTLFSSADLALLPTFGAPHGAAGANASMLLFVRRMEDTRLLALFGDYLSGPGQGQMHLAVASAPLLASAAPCAKPLRACLAVAAAAETLDEQLRGLREAASCCGGNSSLASAEGQEADHACRACSGSAAQSEGGDEEARRAEERLWLALPHATRQAAASPVELGRRGSAVAVCNGMVVPSVPAIDAAPELLARHWCPPRLPGVALEATTLAALVVERDPPSPLMRTCTSGDVPKVFRLHLLPRDQAAPVLASLAGTVNPLGQDTAAFVHLAQVLHRELNAEVCIVLDPQRVEDYPLKRWQRRVIGTSSEGGLSEANGASATVFSRLRTRHTLTMHIVSPPSWLVTAHASEHDLDNIRAVDAVTSGGRASRPEILASFMLSRLYLEGSAHVEGSGNAATGLQMELLPAGAEAPSTSSCGASDTRVMRNHGFWSMPTCPGAFELSLMPGASSDTFALAGSRATPATTVPPLVEVTSFVLPFRRLGVVVRPGRKEGDLVRKTLGRSRPRGSRRGGSKRGNNASAMGADAEAAGRVPGVNESLPTIHIFSVASGHLYERLLAIMVHSVRNHTRCPLHFWIVSNFLSPGFTDMLPRLQNSLEGVTVDLVSFKWPSWLNPQEEKQRLIWAYKILFLDVLFPMDVPRVIFIDSDLVVRADVRELWDMDLQGRAYAFTPFCSGEVTLPDGSTVSRRNPSTTGYRFWESGYWQHHLGPNKHYHISALFVVDLLAFRRESVGDTLRQTYNTLTMDPSSLANLDQDLPNYDQMSIPIFSLPQEWLWCETWCSNATFPMAKAIDLCQNPSTKEPKAAMARRVISEWDAYHARVVALRGPQGAGVGGSEVAREPAKDGSRSEL